ncbi:MAG: phosphatase PAP2 family protein [Ruminococcaceae bacterium]|jgi:membrane-associated phospholipid phosphatase|nr:phosphatase PAP2 family protein [Oscillospiraceae bacterium]
MSSEIKKKKGFYMSEKTILAIILFVVVFGALLVTATFTDLQVSQFLTKFSLPKGQYYADDVFGRAFETIGCSPIYLMLAFAFHIIFWNVFLRIKDMVIKYILLAVSTGCGVAAYAVMGKDVLRYIVRQIGYEESLSAAFITCSMVFIGCVACFVGTLAVRNFKDETIKNLLTFAIAVIIIAAVANGFVNLIKIPAGRMRYRAMNTEGAQLIGGFKNYTRWYVFNGQRFTENEFMWYFGTTDACKSFPSGHTCSAGMSYCLVMLIDVLKIKSKGKKIALWVCPIVYTGLVALSRIMVGAHFFSDVLIGGTVAFLTMLLFREILICKGSHFKAAK